jgi:Aldehyde dehydrogenase family
MRTLINPATGTPVAEVPDSSPSDVADAVRLARSAYEVWRDTTPGERARVLLRLADLVEADAEELTRLEVEDTGKPAAVFRDGEPAPPTTPARTVRPRPASTWPDPGSTGPSTRSGPYSGRFGRATRGTPRRTSGR